nr:FecR domain-containing protein [uncultured Draconibacterium sp.]
MHIDYNIKSIIKKYVENKCDAEELETIFLLFEEPDQNLSLRASLFEIWLKEEFINSTGLSDGIEQTQDFHGILNKIHHQINLNKKSTKNKKIVTLALNVLKIAAVILLVFFAGHFYNNFNDSRPVYYTSISPKGSISQIILPDSSTVFLNSGSEIKYSLNSRKNEREIVLSGEAWFEVTENKKRPFIVHTPCYDVKVLGTRFNVKAYESDDEIVTTLEKGSVEIVSSDKLKLKSDRVLSSGEQLIYNKLNKAIETKAVNTYFYTSWKDNKLIFINMNLKELIVLLERKFGVDIEVANDMILDFHYDGIIKNETILEVLKLLEETLPIQYKIEGQKVIIKNK